MDRYISLVVLLMCAAFADSARLAQPATPADELLSLDIYGAADTAEGECSGGDHYANASSGFLATAYTMCDKTGCRECRYNQDWCTRFVVDFVHLGGTYTFTLRERCRCELAVALPDRPSACCSCEAEGGYYVFHGCVRLCQAPPP